MPALSRQWTLLLASTLTVMAGATLSPALPALETVFVDTPHADLLTRLVLTLPALFIVLAAPLAGRLVDRVGRVRILVYSAWLYVIAGASGAVLNSLESILIGRALLGVAVGGLMTAVTTLISDYFDGNERARVLGRQGAFMSLGGVFFLLAGGMAADLHWRASFLVYLVPVLLLPSILRLEEPPRQGELQTAVASEVPRIRISVIYAAALMGMLIYYIIPVQLPYHLVNLTGSSSTATGLAIAVGNVCGGISGLLFSRVRERLPPVAIVSVIYALMAMGYAIVGLAGSYSQVLVGLAISGLGLGMTVPNATTWLSSFTPPDRRGQLIGGLTAAVFVGQFLSPIVVQPLIEIGGPALAFEGAALLLAVLSVVAFVMRHRGGPTPVVDARSSQT
jgi:MFS family permease